MTSRWQKAAYRENYAKNEMKLDNIDTERELAKSKGFTKDGWFCHVWGNASGNRYAIIGPNGTIYTDFKEATDAHNGKDTTENFYKCQACGAVKKARPTSSIRCKTCHDDKDKKQHTKQRSVTDEKYWKKVKEEDCIGEEISVSTS